MSSYHHRGPTAAPRRSSRSSVPGVRSSSAVSNGTSGSLYGQTGRPKSMNSVFVPKSSRSPYGHHGLVGYGGSGSTGYLATLGSNYGGTSSGYGNLVVPSSTSASALNRSSSPASTQKSSFLSSFLPSSLSKAVTNAKWTPSRGRTLNSSAASSITQKQTPTTDSSRRPRPRSRSTPRSSSVGTLSRSASNTSLGSVRSAGSEGYASGGDRSSRLSSSSLGGGDSTSNSRGVTPARSENGEVDYKKLYEESQVENERLREKLKKTEDELKGSKSNIDNVNVPNKNNMSELEKRERRAMERKLSEMEEELKQLQKLKMENERLRSENRALTRVVTKLTSSANARI